MKQPINGKISALRKARALTQEQLGAKLGVSGQAVSKWEKGESLPDLLLLPALCGILGITVDALLEVPVSEKKEAVLDSFCAYAKETGPAAALLEVFRRLFGSNFHLELGKETMLVARGGALGFTAGAAGIADSMRVPGEQVGYAMRVLENEGCRALLCLLSSEEALTTQELCAALRRDPEAVTRMLMGCMKRGVVVCGVDAKGKRGYLLGRGMAAVCMVLTGSALLSDPYGAGEMIG